MAGWAREDFLSGWSFEIYIHSGAIQEFDLKTRYGRFRDVGVERG